MSNRIDSQDRPQKPVLEMCVDRGDGHMHITRCDNEADMIREVLVEETRETGVSINVVALEDRWVRIEVTYPENMSEKHTMLVGDLLGNITGKGWYEVKSEEFPAGSSTHSIVCRHMGGPYV